MTVDAWGFDEERQALAHRIYRKRLRLRALHLVVLAVLVATLVFGGAAALRDFVLSLLLPGWLAAVIFLGILFGAFAALQVPFSYVGGFLWEHATGMSNQDVLEWLKDVAKSTALGFAATVLTGGLLIWLLATTPWWWLVAWVLGVSVSVVLGFVAPIWLVPLFYSLRPIRDDALRARFEALALRARVPILGVFELYASAKTKRSNAAVMGFGRTRRIVVTDTLLADFSAEEIDTVLAHELAHQRNFDPIRGFLAGSLISLAIVASSATLYGVVYASFGIRSLGDLAGLPLLFTLLGLVAIPFRPLELRWSREREASADLFALELTQNPGAFVDAMVRLHDRNLGVASPRPWEQRLFYSHPSGRERVERARAFSMRHG